MNPVWSLLPFNNSSVILYCFTFLTYCSVVSATFDWNIESYFCCLFLLLSYLALGISLLRISLSIFFFVFGMFHSFYLESILLLLSSINIWANASLRQTPKYYYYANKQQFFILLFILFCCFFFLFSFYMLRFLLLFRCTESEFHWFRCSHPLQLLLHILYVIHWNLLIYVTWLCVCFFPRIFLSFPLWFLFVIFFHRNDYILYVHFQYFLRCIKVRYIIHIKTQHSWIFH